MSDAATRLHALIDGLEELMAARDAEIARLRDEAVEAEREVERLREALAGEAARRAEATAALDAAIAELKTMAEG